MKGIDYTTGSIHLLLFRTAIPMLLASMVNVITQLANVFFWVIRIRVYCTSCRFTFPFRL